MKRPGLARRPGLSQILTWVIIFIGLFLAVRLASDVLASRSMSIDFSFLGYPANFDISGSALSFSGSDSYAKALLIGFINTSKAAVFCIVMATILGLLIGVARLSSNPLLRATSGLLVEVLRNVPPLLQLFAWSAVLQFSLPPPAKALEPVAGVALSNRGIAIPFISFAEHISPLGWFASVVSLAAVGVLVWQLLFKPAYLLGKFRPLPLILLALGLIILFASATIAVEFPERRGFNFRGGMTLSTEFAALVISLSLYTAGYIAEIVRGAVLAVPRGQSEAASALGLHPFLTLRLVVLPQALRIAIPPTTNQYINATKSTSLAVAVGYSDIVSIGNTIMNQSGRAIEVIVVFVLAYLSLNLVISAIMNRLNRQLTLA